MRILVVDDEEISRKFLVKALTRFSKGDTVEAYGDAEGAIAALCKSPADLVITDLVMPGASGIDVLQAAKEQRPCTEVIVLTGHASIETAVEAMRKGARDYVEKPVDVSLLKEKVENVRDLLGRMEEAEEYRLAKEVCEENASCMLREMETLLQTHRLALKGIRGVLSQDSDDAEKVRRIETILSSLSVASSHGGKE